VTARSTALMIIDVQYLDAHRDFGIGLRGQENGWSKELEYYFSQLEMIAIPNMQRLLKASRGAALPVVHVRVMNLAADSSDTSRRYKAFRFLTPPGSKEAEFLEEVAPLQNEIVLNKTTSSVFVSTNADFMFRNMGIDTLIVAGVTTNSCVDSCVRGAGDLGFDVLLVGDACTTFTQELHDFTLSNLHGSFCSVRSTDQVIGDIATLASDQFAAR
jgi:nicotinamidase-related amidase